MMCCNYSDTIFKLTGFFTQILRRKQILNPEIEIEIDVQAQSSDILESSQSPSESHSVLNLTDHKVDEKP